jgi:hypothetical protein
MSDAAAAAPAPGWRKRHPVLARAVLYGVGGAVFAVVLVLFLQRRGEDRDTQVDALEKQLASVDLVFAIPGGHAQVLALLDRDFSAPDLPAGLRQRVLRVRGLAHEKGEDLAAAESAFAAAEPLATGARDRAALLVEWAEARAFLGTPESALALLDRPDAASDGAIALLHARVRAFALARARRDEESRRVLAAALAAAPTPPPEGPVDHVGLRDWTPAEAAQEVRRGQEMGSVEAASLPPPTLHEALKSSPAPGR